jgi:hypothetical protein
MILTAGLSRSSGEQQTLLIPPGTSSVRLQLSLERDDYPSYGAVLETAEGKEIWQKNGLRSQPSRNTGRAIIVLLSPSVLKDGDFMLLLTGGSNVSKVQELATYTFRVLKP